MLTKSQKNIISILLGCVFCYLFVVFVSVVAAFGVPQALQTYDTIVITYYSNTLTSLVSAIVSFVVLSAIRQWFIQLTLQNLFFFTLPIGLFFIFLLAVMRFAALPLIYAAIPTIIIAAALSRSEITYR